MFWDFWASLLWDFSVSGVYRVPVLAFKRKTFGRTRWVRVRSPKSPMISSQRGHALAKSFRGSG